MVLNKIKKFKPRVKARIRKNRQIINKNLDNFFDWVKGAKLVELNECDTTEDPIRPQLDNKFRTSYGRKIYGVEYKGEIHAIMCFATQMRCQDLLKNWINLVMMHFYKVQCATKTMVK